MSIGRTGARAAFAGVGVLVAMAFGAVSASAETASFTKAECTNWTVPSGVHELTVTAVGGAGHDGNDAESGKGGNGDEVPAKIAVTANEVLDVCVAQGAGQGGTDQETSEVGGAGGGASGVARGNDFSNPVLIAGGGGGGGARSFEISNQQIVNPVAGADGGAAGTAGGGTKGGSLEGGSPSDKNGPGLGGKGGFEGCTPVPGGGFGECSAAQGAGGGGGGGAIGGGGGHTGETATGGGGGAGGTDLCAGTGVTCGLISPGAGTGQGGVTITYTVPITVQERLTTLLTAVKGVGPGKALTNKVNAIQGYVAANNKAAACTELTGFLSLVKAQAGKKQITKAQAESFTKEAEEIQAALGC